MEACDSDGTDGPEDHDHEHGPLNDATAAVLIASLVAANPIEYDQRRKEAAKRLRVRVETIDSEVHKARQAVISDHDVPRPPDYSEENLAQTFSARHHGQLRYVAEWGKWMIFGEGGCWRGDNTLKVFDLCRAVCREASAACGDERLGTELASARTVAAVERLARSDRRHAATADQWDQDIWMLNTPDGAVDLRTGAVRVAHAEDYFSKSTAVGPSNRECPLWCAFLVKVTNDDLELQLFLQRAAGYCLTGSTREHALFYAYGTGRNGKGTFLNTLTSLLGDYATTAPMETFTASRRDRHPTDLAMLRGARLVTAQETEEGRVWAEARIKALTGGDPITARFMGRDFFTYIPQFKLFAAGNHKPGIRQVDEAFRARINLIPFLHQLLREERDKDLPKKLQAEWSGILQWAIDGCLIWQERGLEPPDVVRQATDDYLTDEDALALWIAERCRVIGWGQTEVTALYVDWRQWAQAAGEDPGSKRLFSQAVESRGYRKTRTSTGRMAFERIALSDVSPPHTEPAHERDWP